MVSMNFNLFLIAIFVLNTIQIIYTGLSFDESYYWIYSLSSKFGHFDHPPMVGWLIKFGTFLFGKNEFGVRFFFNLLHVATIKLLWEMTNKNNLIVFIFAILSMPLIASAGFLALPDTPLVFFSVLFLYFVKKYQEVDNWQNTIMISIVISLLFYSKYHGIVVVLFTVLANLSFLKRKSFWLIVFLTVVFYLPHVYWQYSHDFVTFKYHLFGRKEKHFSIFNILDYVGGQILLAGLISAPFVFLAAFQKSDNQFERILKFNVWGMFALLLVSALRNKIEANWTITNSAILVVLVTNYLSSKYKIKNYIILSLPIILTLFFIKFYIMFTPVSPFFKRAFEIYSWNNIVNEISNTSKGQKLVANQYQVAAKLSFYSNEMVPALHWGIRSSEFQFIQDDFYPKENEVFTFISYDKLPGSVNIEIGYPKVIYATPDMTLTKLREYLTK